MRIEAISYSKVERELLPVLVSKLSLDDPLIVALPRGGLYIALRLAHHLNVPSKDVLTLDLAKSAIEVKQVLNTISRASESGRSIVYVDDLVCTGAMYERIAAMLSSILRKPAEARNHTYVTLFRRRSAKLNKPQRLRLLYAERILHERWLDFFWEQPIIARSSAIQKSSKISK